MGIFCLQLCKSWNLFEKNKLTIKIIVVFLMMIFSKIGGDHFNSVSTPFLASPFIVFGIMQIMWRFCLPCLAWQQLNLASFVQALV
jgi:hypothetical protein